MNLMLCYLWLGENAFRLHLLLKKTFQSTRLPVTPV